MFQRALESSTAFLYIRPNSLSYCIEGQSPDVPVHFIEALSILCHVHAHQWCPIVTVPEPVGLGIAQSGLRGHQSALVRINATADQHHCPHGAEGGDARFGASAR